ncbi:MAG TPA: transposase [Ktedonobacteraceae bacterium]|nr:transposase [Ktedonobacteraceae bacterium]
MNKPTHMKHRSPEEVLNQVPEDTFLKESQRDQETLGQRRQYNNVMLALLQGKIDTIEGEVHFQEHIFSEVQRERETIEQHSLQEKKEVASLRVNEDYQLSDSAWRIIVRLVPLPKKKNQRGRPQMDDRRAMTAIIYKHLKDCHWKAIPNRFGASSTIHDRFQQWKQTGVFTKMGKCSELSEFVDVRLALQKILKKESFINYNLACRSAKKGDVYDAIIKLKKAFALDPLLRFAAQQDTEFVSMREEPAFCVFLYGEESY